MVILSLGRLQHIFNAGMFQHYTGHFLLPLQFAFILWVSLLLLSGLQVQPRPMLGLRHKQGLNNNSSREENWKTTAALLQCLTWEGIVLVLRVIDQKVTLACLTPPGESDIGLT